MTSPIVELANTEILRLRERIDTLEVALRNARSNLETHDHGELLRTCAGCRATHELIEVALSSSPQKD